jgi:dinuclear metal center YbgI/SA1388 family protein
MILKELISFLETWAHPSLAADYDNVGLQTGNPNWEVKAVLISIDCTEAVVNEAIALGANVIICHHPVIFKGLKSLTGKNYVERTVIQAIKYDTAIYAIHTNLDAKIDGVNYIVAEKLGLKLDSLKVLRGEKQLLQSLTVYVPSQYVELVKNATFEAGAGQLGHYSSCSFQSQGEGQFKADENAKPFLGTLGILEKVEEMKLELTMPRYLTARVVEAMKKAHPYEEAAYSIQTLENQWEEVGTGLIGELPEPMPEYDFLIMVKTSLNVSLIRHTAFLGKPVKRIALSGGTCSFLIPDAIAKGADVFITADIKYHEFFNAEGKVLLADINHFESEQFTSELIGKRLIGKFANIAMFFSKAVTNPIQYL